MCFPPCAEFIEGVSQFSVEGDRDKKLKCKSITLVLGGVNTHVIEHLSYKTIHTYNNIVKGTQRIYVYFRPRGEPTLCSAPIPAIGFSCTLCFDT